MKSNQDRYFDNINHTAYNLYSIIAYFDAWITDPKLAKPFGLAKGLSEHFEKTFPFITIHDLNEYLQDTGEVAA